VNHRRVFSQTIAVVLAAAVAASASPIAFAQERPKIDANEARKQLMEGDTAARAKNWSEAVDHYTKSNDAMPNVMALTGLANAQYQLGKVLDAYASYADLLKTYGDRLARPQKTEAETRLAELGSKTGTVTITVDEPGVAIAIDGRAYGQSPRATPIRLVAGAHLFSLTKEGFVTFEKSTDVPGGGSATVDVKMSKVAAKGTLTVREKAGLAVRVVIDGSDVGPAPWTGEVEPGAHEVMVRSSSYAAPPQKIDVQKGAKLEVELVAAKAAAHLEVKTSDNKGNVYVDGKLVGEGSFSGDVGVGPHEIEVRREGYDPFKKSVVLADRQVYAESVALRRPGATLEETKYAEERQLLGVYGGFGVLGVAQIGGMGTELETHCSALGAVSCDTPGPLGGGAFGYVGYTFNPVGFEIFLGGLVDHTTQKATFDGAARNGENPLLATPARTESFSIFRVGGMGAIRVRGTVQTQRIRASLAAGLGLSYKVMAAQRKTESTDGRGLTDNDVLDTVSYVSPAISADLAIHFRAGPATGLSLGVMLWAENAGNSAATSPDTKRFLTNAATQTAVPLATPAYHLASSPQVFLGPYVGMQFGP
jgi:hypothetical protein